MKVGPDQVRHVASLARLEVSDDQIQRFVEDLSRILDYVDQLASVDLGTHATSATGAVRLRPDVPEPPGGPALIALAADRVGDEVRVPQVVGSTP